MSDFGTFVLKHLPAPPCRVLEIGCGRDGGLVEELAARGYDVLGVDPDAPGDARYLRTTFQEAASNSLLQGAFGAVVAGRVLHHVHPLGDGLDLLASLAPLLVVDEFAWDSIDAAAQEWYEGQHRMLTAAGGEPYGPASLDEWRVHVAGHLHPHTLLLDGLRARYDEVALEWVPYFHRWLGGPSSEALEEALIDAGGIPAIGYRWAGARTSTTRSSASSR